MITHKVWDLCEIKRRNMRAYRALTNLLKSNDFDVYCKEIEGFAEIERRPSLINVYYDNMVVTIEVNEINGAIEDIRCVG